MTSPDPARDTEPLARLLGPDGPELSCDECFEHLDRYVEAELAGRNAESVVPTMEAHLEGCVTCREERDSLVTLLRAETG